MTIVIDYGHLWYNQSMITVSVSEFKAKCLAIIERVRLTGEPILITKNGKPAVTIESFSKKQHAKFGYARGEFQITGDILEPLSDQGWEALQD